MKVPDRHDMQQILRSVLKTKAGALCGGVIAILIAAILMGQLARLGRPTTNDSETTASSERSTTPEREKEEAFTRALTVPTNALEAEPVAMLPWTGAAALSDSELENYLLLTSAEKLMAPQDIAGLAAKAFEQARKGELTLRAEEEDARRANYLEDASFGIGLEDSSLVQFLESDPTLGAPVSLRQTIDLVLRRIEKHNQIASEYRARVAPYEESLLQMAESFEQYPLATRLRTIAAYTGLKPEIEADMRRIAETAATLYDRGQSLHDIRTIRLLGEMLYALDVADKAVRTMNRDFVRGVKRVLATFVMHPTEYTHPNAIVRARMRHRYAMACDDLTGITKSRWTWKHVDAERAARDFDRWYAWATNDEWYAESQLVLDKTQYPKGEMKTQALFEELGRLVRDDAELFLTETEARRLRALTPPLE